MLGNAHAVAIIPGVLKGSFVVGIRRGKGVLCVRDANGRWGLPAFVTLTGGSLGWQVGVQSTDLILVFQSPQSVQNLLRGKLTIGVDVSAAAGPVGRSAAAATDTRLQAEVYSYSRSRGLFAGVSLNGASVEVDPLAASGYYATPPGPDGVRLPPPPAQALVQRLNAYSRAPAPAALPAAPAAPNWQAAVAPATAETRGQLAAASQRLAPLLDQQWQRYLQIPLDGTVAELQAAAQRFETVAADPKFSALQQRGEFRTVRQLLQRYALQRQSNTARLQLPPPPAGARR
jgi:lipid-binding SYLF domain-containing protein